uniref:Plantaricin n=1 Tax=Lactiplantibacillus plantarum subsp. plantarum TaxID=337330 RepID=T1WIT7_LACPN|nr:plantaricin [Lactiplantibacillus plantarum subsp. plantarum]
MSLVKENKTLVDELIAQITFGGKTKQQFLIKAQTQLFKVFGYTL